jgi:hypothetical protein
MAKGFTPPRTVYRLDFEGTELEGLEVRMRGGKLAQAFDTVQLVGITEANATAEDAKLALDQYKDLAGHIISWNLEDEDGQPVTPDLEGLKTQELRHIRMIAAAWQRAQVDVPGPLPSESSSTSTPDLLMIPMESIPASLVN